MKKTKITLEISRNWNVNDTMPDIIRRLISEFEECGGDGALRFTENMDDDSITFTHEVNKYKSTSFKFKTVPEFLDKYCRHISPFEVARAFLDYGSATLTGASCEEIPDPPKEEACSGT